MKLRAVPVPELNSIPECSDIKARIEATFAQE
jgi:hypothetical protein